MAGIDWNAPLQSGGDGTSFREKYPQIFGGQAREASPPGSEPPAPAPAPAPEPSAEAPRAAENYADMPMSEVLSRGISNAPGSAWNAIKGVGSALYNYEDTLGSLNQLGKGVVSKVRGALGGERNLEAEAMADALGQMYADRYGSMEGFKKTLAEDPFAIGLDVASVAPIVGPAARLAGAPATVARGLERVASLGDPVSLAAQGVKTASKVVTTPAKEVLRYSQGMASGVPQGVLKIAEQAGKTGNPVQRNAFLTFAMGKGDNRDIARTAMEAVEELRQRASDTYTTAKQGLTTDPLPTTEIRGAVNKLKMELDPHNLGLFPELRKTISEIERQVDAVENGPAAARSAEGLDRLKRSLNDVVREFRGTQHIGALGQVPRAVRDTISQYDSGYASMMDHWENWRNELLDFQKTLGTTDKVAENTRLAKLLSTAKKEDRMSLLQELAEKTQSGQTLPYMIAGSVVEHLEPKYLQGFGLAGIGSALMGGPHGVALMAAGSPRLAGLTSYGMGRAGDLADRMVKAPPSAITNYLSQVGQDQLEEPRPERKSGGRVGVNHERIADQLVTAAERAKKGISEDTKPLLDLPDNHIAQALEVANRSI